MNFALIGAAGYVAPKHMKAIKETGNKLVSILDISDSVGIIDSYFPNANFFTEFERFDRHIEKLRRGNIENQVQFVSICSPNYLHDAHTRFSLRVGANAICEKPLVLNPWNLDALEEIERESGKKIYNILQLRHHPSIIELKKKVSKELKNNPDKIFQIDLTYLTSRGPWYFRSWKGDINKSGGIATNIGIHFFDMLLWIFGDIKENNVHINKKDTAAGFLQLKHACIRWFLSISYNNIPERVKELGQRTFRSITIDGKEIEFSQGFTDLHTLSYQKIFSGCGFGLGEVRSCIEAVYQIRNSKVNLNKGDLHPFSNRMTLK